MPDIPRSREIREVGHAVKIGGGGAYIARSISEIANLLGRGYGAEGSVFGSVSAGGLMLVDPPSNAPTAERRPRPSNDKCSVVQCVSTGWFLVALYLLLPSTDTASFSPCIFPW